MLRKIKVRELIIWDVKTYFKATIINKLLYAIKRIIDR